MDKSIEKLERIQILNGDCLEELNKIEENSIDSIVTDPPYGLTSIVKRFGKDNSAPVQYGKDGSFSRLSKGFMGKEWDGSGIEYNVKMWQKCLRVLKPGGYLLAFGGSRTFHRIACAIEDAGFEIRDTIMWLYGSGFPKSQNISKILDKKFGKERPIIGYTDNAGIAKNAKPDSTGSHIWSGNIRSDEPITDLAKQWNGWGTAMKPSYESIIVAQKPYSIEIYLLIGILDILNEVIDKCQLNLNANIVKKISKLNQVKQSVEENIVLKNAENKMFTSEDLLDVMDMLQSTLMENMNLNTELLCLNFLVEICNQMNKYTIETKINLITELKILKLLVVENILKNTTKEVKMKQLGMKQNALTVEEFLKEEKLKLNYMNILSVQDNVILKEEENNLHPSLNQIIVARKPFKGSLVDNVIEYGVGGINIDECRVETNEKIETGRNGRNNKSSFQASQTNDNQREFQNSGRFPANTILTYDDTDFEEVCGGFPYTKNSKRSEKYNKDYDNSSYKINYTHNPKITGDNGGSASRYFYCAKANKKDRDEGLDEFEEKEVRVLNATNPELEQKDDVSARFITVKKNTHPTVKPTELMQYLIRLVTPKGGVILDPFMGSGSTGKAAMFENKERNADYKFIGIEKEKEYIDIAKARIDFAMKMADEEKQEEVEQITFFE